MNFPFYIARRYLISFSKNNAINIITGIASLGIVVGAMALFIVLSVFSGLKDFSLSFTNAFDPDLKAVSILGKNFSISSQQEQDLKKIEGIAFYSKVAEERVLFMFNGKEQVAYLKGVDSNFINVNQIQKNILVGEWLSTETNQVVAGYNITRKLSLGLFDFNHPLEVFVPKPGKGRVENPEDAFNKSALTLMGVYNIGEETIDSKYVFLDLELAQTLLEMKPNQITGIEFKLKPGISNQKIITQINTIFDNKLTIKNRAQLNDALYKMLNTENIAVYLIFTLVIIVTLFNLIGAIIMMILDKKGNLKTLFNLGVEIKSLRKIFLFHGSLLCLVGSVIGIILGAGVILLQQHLELVMINSSFAYPVKFTAENILIVLATIMVLGFIASGIAAGSITKRLVK